MRLVAVAYLLFAVLAFSISFPFYRAMSEAIASEAALAAGDDRDCILAPSAWKNPISPKELMVARDILAAGNAGRAEVVTGQAFTDSGLKQREDLDEYRRAPLKLRERRRGFILAPREREDCGTPHQEIGFPLSRLPWQLVDIGCSLAGLAVQRTLEGGDDAVISTALLDEASKHIERRRVIVHPEVDDVVAPRAAAAGRPDDLHHR